MSAPAAAIVINHNGGDDLPRCLDALTAQSEPVEVVLVDCLSTDGTRSLAERPPVGVRGVPLPENRGYAGGANAGLAVLPADVVTVGFFNPDCFPRPDFFAVCTALLSARPEVGGIAARLERPDGIHLDSCGQVPSAVLLHVRDRGYGQPPSPELGVSAAVLSACGAVMVYRRAALAAAAVDGEAFAGEFFSFWEDFDLGWRVSNAGFRVVYEPRAVAVHRRGATASPGGGRLIFRRPPAIAACILVNRWASWAHNLHGVDFWLRLPVLLPVDALAVLAVVVGRPAVLPELLAAMRRLGRAWRRRGALRQRRLGELL
jgi:GT2 family glycosyltransferase